MTTMLLSLLTFILLSLIWGGICAAILFCMTRVRRHQLRNPTFHFIILILMIMPVLFLFVPIHQDYDAGNAAPIGNFASTLLEVEVNILDGVQVESPENVRAAATIINVARGAALLYFLGLAIRLFQFIRGYALVRTIITGSEKFREKDQSNVLLTKKSISPFAAANQHGIIVLPEKLLREISPQQLGMVIQHEQAHLKRKDPQLFLVLEIIDSIFWFNPFLLQQTHGFRLAAEFECDRAVLSQTYNQPDEYADALMKVLKSTSRHALPKVPSILPAGNKGNHRQRLIEIMKPSTQNERRKIILPLILLASFAIPASVSAMSLGQNTRDIVFKFSLPEPNSSNIKDFRMSKTVADKIRRAYEYYDDESQERIERTKKSIQFTEQILKQPNLLPYEEALTHQVHAGFMYVIHYGDYEKYDDIRSHFQKAYDLNALPPDYMARVTNALGQLYYQSEEYERAQEYLYIHYNSVAEENHTPNLYHLMASLHYILEEYEQSLDFANKALLLRPDFEPTQKLAEVVKYHVDRE